MAFKLSVLKKTLSGQLTQLYFKNTMCANTTHHLTHCNGGRLCLWSAPYSLPFLLLNATKSANDLNNGTGKCLGNPPKCFMVFSRQYDIYDGLVCLELISTSNTDSRRVARSFSRIRIPQTLWTKHGHLWLWLPDVSLYHDLELNPGPKEEKAICTICGKAVRRNQAAILCGNCASCFHAKCSGLTKDAINKLNILGKHWLCMACSLPQINDSFFDSSVSSLDVSYPSNCSDTRSACGNIRNPGSIWA